LEGKCRGLIAVLPPALTKETEESKEKISVKIAEDVKRTNQLLNATQELTVVNSLEEALGI
jgi:nitrate/nitrite-specific signal transduction histidine kinase